jgi:polyribonucleotide nucleotidyltransferase
MMIVPVEICTDEYYFRRSFLRRPPPAALMMSLENNADIPSHMLPVPTSPARGGSGPLAIAPDEEYLAGSYDDETRCEEMECPHSKVGVVIGSKGIIIQEIMHRTNCKIVVMQDGLPDGMPRTVMITGYPPQIQLAKQLINSVIADGPSAIQSPGIEFDPAEPVETQEMACPAEKVGLVIGSKGIIVQDIMRRTGCKITVNQNFPEGEPRVVVITGQAANIEFAKSLVALVIANGPAALNQSSLGMNLPGYVTEEMECPHERVGIVIGAKGTIVQDIMRRSGSRIIVQQDFPDGHPRKVVISGNIQQVRHAKHLVSAVIMHGPVAVQGQPMMNPATAMVYGGSVVQDLKIVQSQVGKLIGPGGSTIKELQLRFAVKMNIDQLASDTDERRLRITGEPARVQAASQMIWHILHNNNPMGMMHHQTMHSQVQAGYGMPLIGEGYGEAMSHSGYYGSHPSSHGHSESSGLHPSHAPIGQGLGADGSSGRLMPASPLSNGFLHQVPTSPLSLPHSLPPSPVQGRVYPPDPHAPSPRPEQQHHVAHHRQVRGVG